MYGRGVSCYVLWSIEIAEESGESNQRNVLGAKGRLRNRGTTRMSCFKAVVIKNYTENSAKLPGCLNHRGKSTHCANKKNMLFSQCITPFQIHCSNGRNVPSYTEKEIVFKVREAWGGTGGGGDTLGDPEIFARPLLCQGFPGDISLCD